MSDSLQLLDDLYTLLEQTAETLRLGHQIESPRFRDTTYQAAGRPPITAWDALQDAAGVLDTVGVDTRPVLALLTVGPLNDGLIREAMAALNAALIKLDPKLFPASGEKPAGAETSPEDESPTPRNGTAGGRAEDAGIGRTNAEADEGITGEANPVTAQTYLFARLRGGRYQIAFGTKEETVPGLAGLQVVEYLLKQPGKEAHVLDINRALCEGSPRAAPLEDAFVRSEQQKGLDGFSADASRAPDPCSVEDLERAKEAVESLDEQAARARERGEHDQADQLERSVDTGRRWIRQQERLAEQMRLGQPDQDSQVEKVRLKLTNNFTNALKKLTTQYGCAELADHLEGQIDRGTVWKYRPVPGIEWSFDTKRR